MAEPIHRCGYAALAGRPNVGKSTLLNALVGSHLSIVSEKAQTTRERVSGVLTGEDYQVLFVDAPGLIEPRYELQQAMKRAAEAALNDADLVVFVADGTRPATLPGDDLAIESRGLVVAVNKIDLLNPEEAGRMLEKARSHGYDTLAVSATTGRGLEALLERIVDLLPESPPLFPPDYSATQPLRFFAQEFVRETCMDLFREEVPYSIACVVEEFRESQDPIYVAVTIFVERESQKGIVIGKGGSTIKSVGARSRAKIEELIGASVYLDLRVKVLPDWSRKPRQLRRLGFHVPTGSGGGQKRSEPLDS